MKAQANMVSQTSRAKPKAIPLAEFVADIERRRAEYETKFGEPCQLPRNSGKRRTVSKKAMLKAIEDAGGKW